MTTPSERLARILVLGMLVAVALAAGFGLFQRFAGSQAIEVRARMPERGGWMPGAVSVESGETLRLRLISDDVVHGFAIGQSDQPAVDVLPGQYSEVTLSFDRPGKYTYYCTRWCGANHWRMRGTIEVTGGASQPNESLPPLYVRLGLDIDAAHIAEVLPEKKPSAARGAALEVTIPEQYLTPEYYRAHSPEEAWKDLHQSAGQNLTDMEIWDLVASIWQLNSRAPDLEAGQQLYSQNCSACHGETGRGDGVFAKAVSGNEDGEHSNMAPGEMSQPPTDFTKAEQMLAASPAHLQGKIIRGGMGTGMPYWGPIFTKDETWELVALLWTFQFDMETKP